jgi:hypothetical protein
MGTVVGRKIFTRMHESTKVAYVSPWSVVSSIGTWLASETRLFCIAWRSHCFQALMFEGLLHSERSIAFVLWATVAYAN